MSRSSANSSTVDEGVAAATVGLYASGTSTASNTPPAGTFSSTSSATPSSTGSSTSSSLPKTNSAVATPASTSAPSWNAGIVDTVLKADMAAADVNGIVSEAGLAKLFSDLGTELSTSHQTLSASQLTDLHLIATDLNVGESASAYLTYITNALINGNAANATWTGGSSASVALGNLATGDTATQISELDGKWFLGTDLPNDVLNMTGTKAYSFTYSQVSAPLFDNGGSTPSINDVNQGYLGDCFLLAPLAEAALQSPSSIESMITDNGNGTYGVRFYVNGVAEYVTVNSALAGNGTTFNSAQGGTSGNNAGIWASLIEKAYAQFQASGIVTGNSSSNYGNSFTSIGNGGAPELALEEITGAATITDFNAKGTSWQQVNYNASFTQATGTSGLSTASVLATLASDLSQGYDVVLSSLTNAKDSSGKTTLVASHAMSIIGYDAATGNLEIRNPWGTVASGQYWDTTFEVSLNTLLSAGDAITVCKVGSTTPTIAVPTIILGAAESISANTSTLINGISVSDSGASSAGLTITLTDSHGALNVTSNANLVISGAGTTALSISGSLAAINTALSTLVDSNATAGTDNIQVTAKDLSTGLTDTELQSVTVISATNFTANTTTSGSSITYQIFSNVVHGDTLTIADMQSFNAVAISTTNLQTANLSSTSLTNWIKGSLTATGGDLGSHQAGWFTYLGNTYVIEQAHTQGSAWSSGDTLVEFVGTLSLTNAHISGHVLTV